MSLDSSLQDRICFHLGAGTEIHSTASIGGGCIHQATRVSTSRGDFFLKYNRLDQRDNFHAEARGLALLRPTASLLIPQVIAVDATTEQAFILMEFIREAPQGPDFWENFGQRLAAMHRHSQPEFGLDQPNFIGRLPQSNRPHATWSEFFWEQRLLPQLQLAEHNRLAPPELRPALLRLKAKLPDLIPEEAPALLHGDLWSGNFMTGPQGQPCIFDPAVYYGHREAEIAFTRLFGGFHPTFYQAYQEAFPLQAGHENRVDLFNLYPLMVHLNLFGRGYLPDIQRILAKFA